MITVHNLPDTLRAGLTEAEKQILEMGKDQTSISFWPSPAAYAHLVLEKHVKVLKVLWRAGFSTKSLGNHAAPEKPEVTQKSEGLALVGETTEDEAEGSTVGGEVAGATGKAGDWMEVIKEGGSWDSARTIRAAFLGYLLGEGFFPKGLIIVGARLVGPWQWKGAFPAHGLALIGCYLEGPIQLIEANAPAFSLFLGSCYIANPEEDNAKTNSPLLLLQQTQLPSLYFEDCRIGGPIHLKGFRTVQGYLSLVKTLIPSSEVALQIENTVCEWDLRLSETHFGGAVHLKDVKVKGSVFIVSSRIESSSNVALHVEDVEVRSGVTLEGSQLVGGMRLEGGKVEGGLDLRGSHIQSSSDIALHIERTGGGGWLFLIESHLRGRVVLESAEVGDIYIEESVIATPGPLAVHLRGVRAKRLNMKEALFRWIAGGSKGESPVLSDGDSLILVSIEDSRIDSDIRVENIQRAPVEVVLGEGATEGSGDGGDAERGAVRATFQVKETKLHPQSDVGLFLVDLTVVEVVGKWDVEMADTEVLGDLKIRVCSAESVITMRKVKVQRDMLLDRDEFLDFLEKDMLLDEGLYDETFSLLAEKGLLPVGRVELEDVEVGGRLRMRGLRVEKELSLRYVWVGGGVYLEEVEVPGRLHLEELRTVELDLSGAEVRGTLSLLDVHVHTYSDRPWAGLKAIEMKDFSWRVMPVEREAGSLWWRLSWWRKMPLEERSIYMSRLYQSYRLRYYQPPLRLNSEKRYPFSLLLWRWLLQDDSLLERYGLSPLSSYFVGYTAAERRRLRWRMRFMRGIEFALTLLSLILLPLLYLFYPLLLGMGLLLLGMEAIGRLFRRFKRGHEPRSGSGHEKKKE